MVLHDEDDDQDDGGQDRFEEGRNFRFFCLEIFKVLGQQFVANNFLVTQCF